MKSIDGMFTAEGDIEQARLERERQEAIRQAEQREGERAAEHYRADEEAVARAMESYVFDATDRSYEQRLDVLQQQIANLLSLAGVRAADSGVTGDVECNKAGNDCTYRRQGGGGSGSSAIRNSNIREQVQSLELQRDILAREWESYRRKRILGR